MRPLRIVENVGFWFLVLVFTAYTIIPFYWAINTSLKTQEELQTLPVSYIPAQPTLQNYRYALGNQEFLTSILNSFIVAGSVTIFSLVVGSAAAYAIGRYKFYGRSAMRYVVLSMRLFPTIAILPSLLDTVIALGLSNNILSLMITYPLFMLPTTTWPLITYFQGLPPDLEQAAYVDGASPFQMFTKILVPIIMPVLLTTGLMVFVASLSEYLFALTFVASNPDARTVTVAIKLLREPLGSASLMAASVVLSVPLILLIFFTQRHFISNTTEGAVKG